MGFVIIGGCTLPAILFVLIEMVLFRADLERERERELQRRKRELTVVGPLP